MPVKSTSKKQLASLHFRACPLPTWGSSPGIHMLLEYGILPRLTHFLPRRPQVDVEILGFGGDAVDDAFGAMQHLWRQRLAPVHADVVEQGVDAVPDGLLLASEDAEEALVDVALAGGPALLDVALGEEAPAETDARLGVPHLLNVLQRQMVREDAARAAAGQIRHFRGRPAAVELESLLQRVLSATL